MSGAESVRDAPIQGMPCPACQVSLVMSERQGIEIDYCPKCRGVWLDRGELDKIIERSERESSAAGQPAMRQDQTAPGEPPPQAPPSFLPQGAGPWSNPAQPQGPQAAYPPYPPQGGPGYYDDPRSGGHDSGGHGGGHGGGGLLSRLFR